jgi:hypothetical protein
MLIDVALVDWEQIVHDVKCLNKVDSMYYELHHLYRLFFQEVMVVYLLEDVIEVLLQFKELQE